MPVIKNPADLKKESEQRAKIEEQERRARINWQRIKDRLDELPACVSCGQKIKKLKSNDVKLCSDCKKLEDQRPIEYQPTEEWKKMMDARVKMIQNKLSPAEIKRQEKMKARQIIEFKKISEKEKRIERAQKNQALTGRKCAIIINGEVV